MLPAITKLLPHLPRVFRQKAHGKSSVSGDQGGGSDIVSSATSKRLSVRVVLLDRSELTLFSKPNSKVRTLLEEIFGHIGIIEKEYFGLFIRDEKRRIQWVDLQKTVSSQLNGTVSATLYFGVKFYAADPCKLFQEITRYQFFLQVKQDVVEGRLPVPSHIAVELAAYAIQSELGDYDSERHLPGYSSEFDFVPNQTERFERRVEEHHQRLVGLVPARAEYSYLNRIKWLDMYGVDLYPVQGDGAVDYFLGIAPTGIVIYRNKVKISSHFWPRMTKISSKGFRLVLKVRDKDNVERSNIFYCETKQACKRLEQCCVEHHQFFRTNAASYSYQTTIKMFAADTKLRSSVRDPKNDIQTPTFTRRSSRRRQRQSSCSGTVEFGHNQSFISLPPNTSSAFFSSYRARNDSPTSVCSVDFTRRSYAKSEVGCSSSRKRHHHNCCPEMSDAESCVSISSNRRRTRSNVLESKNDHSTPTFTRRSSRRPGLRSSCSGAVDFGHNQRSHSSSRIIYLQMANNRLGSQALGFVSLPPTTSSAFFPGYRARNDSPTSVSSVGCTRRSYARSEVGCSTSRKRHHCNCCTDVSDAESHISIATSRRPRRRRKHLPPEELAQHFRYVDPAVDSGLESEMVQQSIPYTHVDTDASDSNLKVSPRTWQRLRQRQLKIYAARQSLRNSRHAWQPEDDDYDLTVGPERHSLRSRRSVPRFNSSYCSSVAPAQYLQLPVPVQKTEMYTAPIVKIKRTDGSSDIGDETLTNRLSSSSSTGADLYDVHQVAKTFSHSRIEHC